ncbi:uncharacterized protein LOC118437631 [Folsomia candida]|nr:uncharacterized protein LOC118437631 [Folsomia candida]
MLHKDLPDVSIEINEKTVYCVDNDAVKYLAQKEAGVKFQKEKRAANAAAESWEETYEQINQLFSVLQMMTPHDTTKTYSLNQTREICLALGGPLADCTKRILETQADIWQMKDEAFKTLQDGMQLQAGQTTSTTIYRNVTDNENTWNACGSEKCSRTVNDRGMQILIPKYCASQKRSFVDVLIPSSIFKIGTIASAGLTNVLPGCPTCGCGMWHHFVTYEKVIEESIRIINPHVQQMVAQKASEAEIKNAVIKEVENNIQELEREVQIMREAQLTASQFLNQNSLVHTADAYLDRLEQLQDEERSKNSDQSPKFEKLKSLVQEYKKQKDTLTASRREADKKSISLEEVKSSLAELYAQPNYGRTIKKEVEDKMMSNVNALEEIFHSPSLKRYGLPDKRITSI